MLLGVCYTISCRSSPTTLLHGLLVNTKIGSAARYITPWSTRQSSPYVLCYLYSDKSTADHSRSDRYSFIHGQRGQLDLALLLLLWVISRNSQASGMQQTKQWCACIRQACPTVNTTPRSMFVLCYPLDATTMLLLLGHRCYSILYILQRHSQLHSANDDIPLPPSTLGIPYRPPCLASLVTALLRRTLPGSSFRSTLLRTSVVYQKYLQAVCYVCCQAQAIRSFLLHLLYLFMQRSWYALRGDSSVHHTTYLCLSNYTLSKCTRMVRCALVWTPSSACTRYAGMHIRPAISQTVTVLLLYQQYLSQVAVADLLQLLWWACVVYYSTTIYCPSCVPYQLPSLLLTWLRCHVVQRSFVIVLATLHSRSARMLPAFCLP